MQVTVTVAEAEQRRAVHTVAEDGRSCHQPVPTEPVAQAVPAQAVAQPVSAHAVAQPVSAETVAQAVTTEVVANTVADAVVEGDAVAEDRRRGQTVAQSVAAVAPVAEAEQTAFLVLLLLGAVYRASHSHHQQTHLHTSNERSI